MALKTLPRKPKKTLFIVDEHPLFRKGLSSVISRERDLVVCGEAEDPKEAVQRIGVLKPDLAVMDISVKGASGVDLAKSMRARQPGMRLLILSGHPESLYAERALRAGADGYIMKREKEDRILSAIRRVLEGKTYVSQELNETILRRMAEPGEASVDLLSDREFGIFEMIGQGLGTRQIADRLSLSMKTVEAHREHIKQKLKITDTYELVQKAIHWVHEEKREDRTS